MVGLICWLFLTCYAAKLQLYSSVLRFGPRVFCGLADLRTNQWVFCGPKNADLVCGLVDKMRTCGPLKLQLFCWTSRIQQFCESIKYCTFMKWMAFCACCPICLTQARFFLLKTFLPHVAYFANSMAEPTLKVCYKHQSCTKEAVQIRNHSRYSTLRKKKATTWATTQ